MRRLLTLIVVLGLSVILAPNGGEASELSCSARVLSDWSDNGRVDRVYPLRCYEEAIAIMPTDIRDYTDAQDVIERALTSAARGSTGGPSTGGPAAPTAQGGGAPEASSPTSAIALLIVLGGFGLAVLAAGALSSLVRRAALGHEEPHG